MWTHIKRSILAGLFTIVPIAFTIFIIRWLFRYFAKPGSKIVEYIFHNNTPPYVSDLIGFLLTFFSIYLVGLFIKNVIGKRLFIWGERILTSIPLVNTIYKTIKQITQAFSGAGTRTFQSVVWVEYPRRDLWTLAFVTGESTNQDGAEYYHLFVPTTPNPTSGFFIMIPKNDTILANLNVEEGLKAIISGGMLAPSTHDAGIRTLKPH